MGSEIFFLFDVDGVIAETPHEKSWKEAAVNWNLINNDFNFTDFYVKSVAGIPGLRGAEIILENFSYFQKNKISTQSEKERKAKEFREVKQGFLEKNLSEGNFKIFEDMQSLIYSAKKESIPIAAVSSSENAERILKKIGLFDIFDSTTLGAVKHRAPKKDILYAFAFGQLYGKLQLTPLPTPIVFEDSPTCISELNKINYFCVGISRKGLASKEELFRAGANLSYDEFDLTYKKYAEIIEDINSKRDCKFVGRIQ